jgi:chemotaxis protein methyltransferase CheR
VVTVNETYFWREADQIKAAASILVPQLLSNKNGMPVRVWHAACGSGEEPYSMVMALMDANPLLVKKVEIIATDMSEKALDAARLGVYRSYSFRNIPPDMKLRYFRPEPNGRLRLIDSIRNQVQFMRLNLVDEIEMRKMRNFDIIFCRNVFIYFSLPTIKRVVQHLYNSLNTPGHLFVSAVESLLRTTTLFDIVTIDDAYGYLKNGEV